MPEIANSTELRSNDEGAVVVDESDGECDVNTLLAEIELAMNVR